VSHPAPEPVGAPASSPEPVALAACVLLLEIAHADGEFSDVERQHLEFVLERHFALPAESGKLLMEEAERERQKSVDHFRFTQQIKAEYDLGQKMTLAETMWGLVLADGKIDEHEHYLTRKISNLLDLEPGYLSAAKDAATKRRSGSA
ncbi:MAG: TerB family tellurite resistance protein, partial [Gemmatimonas sp.]